MFDFFRKLVPRDYGYARLIVANEEILATGTGAPLLDAFLAASRGAEPQRTDFVEWPEVQDIRRANAEARGDIYARICALTASENHYEPQRRLPESVGRLKRLKHILDVGSHAASSGDPGMSLPGAAAAEFLRLDQNVRDRGLILPALDRRQDHRLRDNAPILLRMVQAAGESALDEALAGLIEATLSHFARREYVPQCGIAETMDFCSLCLRLEGRSAEDHPTVAAYLNAHEATLRLLALWKARQPAALWGYVSRHCGFEGERAWANVRESVAPVASLTPAERGAILSEMFAICAEVNEAIPGAPWTYGAIIAALPHARGGWREISSGALESLWRALSVLPCEMSPELALTVLDKLPLSGWPSAIRFARMVAAALPSNETARCLVESLFKQSDRNRDAQDRRNIEKQKQILLAAVAAPAVSDEAQGVEALARFEAAFDEERRKTAERAESDSRTLDGFSPEQRRTFEALLALSRAFEPRRDSVLGGPKGRRLLLNLAAAAIKRGAPAERIAPRIQSIEKAVEQARDYAGVTATRETRNLRMRCDWLHLDYAGIDQTRALTGEIGKLDDAGRAVFLAAEALADRAPIAAAPTKAWIKEAQALALSPAFAGARAFILALTEWPYFIDADFRDCPALFDHSQQVRRALIWLCAFAEAGEAIKPLTDLALRAFAPLPEGGIANEMIGNACLWALTQLRDGVGLASVARIGARTRYPKVRARINALFEEAAAKAGRSRAEIEEEIAPHHGFDGEGRTIRPLGDGGGQAEISLDERGKAAILWRDGNGKALKAPSEAMKKADSAGVSEAKGLAREIEADHSVQVKRVEKLYRVDRRVDFARWRDFYVEHPFIGPMCRRLVWRAETAEGELSGLWRDGAFEDFSGERHDVSAARIGLWHPIQAKETEIAAWRDRLALLGVNQPFRQAWRETYRVTEAERATGTYSNRFAGHIVRQHQFMALARLNDWNCRHRMWQDVANDEPTYLALPEFGVYAEYWTVGAGGEDPPVAESTAFLYLSTDRVVFHRLNPDAALNKPFEMRGAPLPVQDVPPLAFSEIMRCCDLFVSVATIARDPNWLDRGAQALHPNRWRRQADEYWREATTASLSVNAEMRRALLERLLPALQIKQRLSLDDRFLSVKGARGEYRIHLGSGAAFRADGAHICIVPDGAPKKLVLPYEGDEILALVLSKALLLSRDDKISDPVILRQL